MEYNAKGKLEVDRPNFRLVIFQFLCGELSNLKTKTYHQNTFASVFFLFIKHELTDLKKLDNNNDWGSILFTDNDFTFLFRAETILNLVTSTLLR